MKQLGFVIGWIIGKLITILIDIGLIIGFAFLFIGVIIIDILLRIFKVDKYYLLITDISAWCTMISEHLEDIKNKKI